MKFTATQIAEILNGEIIGNPDVEVHTLSKIEEGIEGSLTFLANPKYTPYIYTTQASITIVGQDFVSENNIEILGAVMKSPFSPKGSFNAVLNALTPEFALKVAILS